jgi:hypothetical protein
MKFALRAAVAAIALTAAMPASAALTVVAACDATRTNPDASKCAGYYDGNLNNNDREGDLNLALDALVGGGGFEPDVVFIDIEDTKDFFEEDGGVLTFETALLGQQILSLHFGNAQNEFGTDVSVLYLFNFAEATSSIILGQDGFSNGVLIGDPGGVPEPATWAMMLMGFGAAGYALRRRRKVLLTQVA